MNTSKTSFSITSILAIIAAVLSFNVGAIAGLLLAAVAFIFGAIGLILALAPGTRGGMLSMLAVILSVIGVIAAIVKAIMWFFRAPQGQARPLLIRKHPRRR
jgi:hypothetical protein